MLHWTIEVMHTHSHSCPSSFLFIFLFLLYWTLEVMHFHSYSRHSPVELYLRTYYTDWLNLIILIGLTFTFLCIHVYTFSPLGNQVVLSQLRQTYPSVWDGQIKIQRRRQRFYFNICSVYSTTTFRHQSCPMIQ